MVKKIVLEIPDEVYKQLVSFSDFYEESVKRIIYKILKAVSWRHNWLIYLNKSFSLSKDIEEILQHIFHVAFCSMSFFDNILERMGVKGEFIIDDFDFKLEEDYFLFRYRAVEDSKYNISYFDVTKERDYVSLSTETMFDIDEIGEKGLNNLKRMTGDYHDFDMLEGFEDVDGVDLEILEGEEECTLVVTCWAEMLEELPTIKQVSKLIKQICEEAEIKVY